MSKAAERNLLVVGIGASAGGLEALEQFFTAAPKGNGIAFVVVQHLEPRHPSLLAELLGRCTQMPVGSISDGEALEPNRVFVIPPNAALTVRNGIMHISPPRDEPRMPINTFFKSLAEDRGELAVGILLSGTGTDGAFGLRAIKEHGGLTLAQPPEAAKHPSMPQHAITAGFVDEVLTVGAMPARVLEYAAYVKKVGRGSPVREVEVRESLGKICEVMQRITGHDFSGYKEGTLVRRIRRRIQVLRVDSAAEYLKRLVQEAEEPTMLLRDLLIGVTQFFREPTAFDSLAEKVIPRLIEERHAERPIRIWVPGCASGEEVYSIAILLQEQRLATGTTRPIQLFATDIDSEALAAARVGRYRADIVDHVSPERLERFFTRVDGGYQVVKELRDQCVFSAHDLVRDPPFSSLDLISCRNLLIYLEPGLQARLIPLLHYALRRGGFLFLGSSEELSGHSELFKPVDKKHRLFERKETLVCPSLDFPLGGQRASRIADTPPAAQPSGPSPKQTVLQAFERMLLERFAPAAAVVDERGEMLCLSGRRSPVLQVPAGPVTNNLLDYAEGALRHALRTTLAESARKRAEVVGPEVVTEVAGAPRLLRVMVSPAPGAPAQSALYAVVIEDLGAARISTVKTTAALSRDPIIEQLEIELKTSRADLRASNEELESAIEELKSSNEELISTNEELQSANEELQTSQEELQSVNEELETVNSELRQKVHELGVANSDLQNLYSSTEVATIFLDRELKLAKFTPAATALFRFIDSDVGRPLSDLAPRFAGTDLLSDVKEVLRTLLPVEREIRAGDAWFILRVLPYRTLDDAIAGAVITFADVTKLKRAQAALKERKRLLNDVIEGSPSLVFLKDMQGRFLSVNKRLEGLLGLTREQLKGKTDFDLFPKDKAEYYREHDRRAAESREPLEIEEVVDFRDGRRVFLASKFPLLDVEGHVYGVGAISHDITERKRVENALLESERRSRLLFDSTSDGALIHTLDGVIREVNDAYCELSGYTREELVGMPIRQLEAKESPVDITAYVERVIARGGHDRFESKHRRKDGSVVDVDITAAYLGWGEDRIAVFTRDITERKRAEEKLRESEERLRSLAENLPSILMRYDRQFRVLYLSPQSEAITGLPVAKFLGKTNREVGMPEALCSRWQEAIDQVFRTGERRELEFDFSSKQGPRTFYLRLAPERAADGSVQHVLGITTDITDRKKAEDAIREADRRKNEFLAMLSHELRNPLAPIKNSLYVLEHVSDAERTRNAQSVIERQVQHLARLVDDLLDVTRISRGKIRLEKERLDLNLVVERTVEDHRSMFTAGGIELTYHGQPGLWVEADRTRASQIVGNLLQNAVKFTPKGGAVSVSLETAGSTRAVIRIRDSGVGMSPEIVHRLFEPFTQADRTLDRTKGGLGLGLALVKGLVELHGGSVAAASEGPGKGAQFEVVLPTLPGGLATPAISAPGEASSAPRRILVVEDNADAADSLREALALDGHEVEVAYSGLEGLERSRAFRPQVVLCDIGLPEMDGHEVARALRADASFAGTMLVALSGYAGPDDIARSHEAGFDHHVSKPLSIQALEHVLAQVQGGDQDRADEVKE